VRFEQPSGATPLDDDAVAGLLVPATTQAELNRFEALAIEDARIQAARSARLRRDFPNDEALRWLHKIMLGSVWSWAGAYRKSEANIGADPAQIAGAVRNLCRDTKTQITSGRNLDEVCARFHHRLVLVHPFVNGNGRHGRLATDILRRNLGLLEWRWGSADLVNASKIRDEYIGALRSADSGDIEPLLDFVRRTHE